MTEKTVEPHVDTAPESPNPIGANRRTVVKGMAAAGLTAGVALPTYLRGFETSAYAQTSAPVKMGFIEDESGNLSVYGIQKLHAAQLAVAEINDGKTLKGAPDIGAGFLGAQATAAKNPPVISKDGTSLAIVDDGGPKSPVDLAYVEDADILIDSGEKGILGRELQLLSSDGQSNNAVWQQLARKLIQEDKVDVLVAGFASAEREAIRPIVDQFKQLYFYTNQYEGGVADANTFCTGPVCEQQVIPTVQYMVEKYGPNCYTIAADYSAN
jgi:ABC-type branched-subunit amino acid transport system substrate-binding protein